MTPVRDAPACIIGSGVAFPKLVSSIATKALLEKLTPDLPEERRANVLGHLMDAFGIESRSWSHWPGTPFAADEEDAATLAVAAARAALDDAKLTATDIGFIVVATSTPPRWTAATSALVAGALDAPAAFLDVRSGCAGGLYALALGASLVSTKPVLVIGSDTFSKVTPTGERFAIMTAGDGAGALVLGPSLDGKGGLSSAAFGGDGKNHDLGTVTARLPPRDGEAFVLSGDPVEFGKRIEAALTEAMAYVKARSATPPTSTYVHVAKKSIAQQIGGANAWTKTLEQHANLNAASVLVAMHEMRSAGLLESGARIAIASAGGGPSWGGATWTVA